MTTPVASTVQSQYDIALGLIDRGDYTNAAIQLEDVLRKEPNNAAAHNDLGVLRYQAGDSTSGLTHLLQALRLDPSNTSYAENIIDVCRALGLDAQASEMEKLLGGYRNGGGMAGHPGPAQGTGASCVVGGIDYDALSPQPEADRNTLLTWYWSFHPRFRFFKSLPSSACVLDIGAGRGGLVEWKEWLSPARTDLRLYAIDLQEAELFARYAGATICNLDEAPIPYANGFFNGAMLCHVLEHLAEPGAVLTELRRVLKAGAQAYVEVPTLVSMDFPGRRDFLAADIPVSTVNFFDDSTHRRTFSLNELTDLARAARFRPVETGEIRSRYVEDALLRFGRTHKDEEVSTYGVWSKLGFAHYVIIEAI
jgi:SAM-dependent methyltransferase